jgi:hypothetical protein
MKLLVTLIALLLIVYLGTVSSLTCYGDSDHDHGCNDRNASVKINFWHGKKQHTEPPSASSPSEGFKACAKQVAMFVIIGWLLTNHLTAFAATADQNIKNMLKDLGCTCNRRFDIAIHKHDDECAAFTLEASVPRIGLMRAVYNDAMQEAVATRQAVMQAPTAPQLQHYYGSQDD